jgi:hypothetical protein
VSHPAACALVTETAKAPKVKMQMRSERVLVTVSPFVVSATQLTEAPANPACRRTAKPTVERIHSAPQVTGGACGCKRTSAQPALGGINSGRLTAKIPVTERCLAYGRLWIDYVVTT